MAGNLPDFPCRQKRSDQEQESADIADTAQRFCLFSNNSFVGELTPARHVSPLLMAWHLEGCINQSPKQCYRCIRCLQYVHNTLDPDHAKDIVDLTPELRVPGSIKPLIQNISSILKSFFQTDPIPS